MLEMFLLLCLFYIDSCCWIYVKMLDRMSGIKVIYCDFYVFFSYCFELLGFIVVDELELNCVCCHIYGEERFIMFVILVIVK